MNQNKAWVNRGDERPVSDSPRAVAGYTARKLIDTAHRAVSFLPKLPTTDRPKTISIELPTDVVAELQQWSRQLHAMQATIFSIKERK